MNKPMKVGGGILLALFVSSAAVSVIFDKVTTKPAAQVIVKHDTRTVESSPVVRVVVKHDVRTVPGPQVVTTRTVPGPQTTKVITVNAPNEDCLDYIAAVKQLYRDEVKFTDKYSQVDTTLQNAAVALASKNGPALAGLQADFRDQAANADDEFVAVTQGMADIQNMKGCK